MNATTGLASQAQMAVSAPPGTAPQKTTDIDKAKETAKKFEAMFMTQMLSHMFQGVESEKGAFGGGHAESMFRPMLLDEYGKMIANRGNGIGLADHVTRSLLAHQEVQ
jgi:flagellar protein FlgJ